MPSVVGNCTSEELQWLGHNTKRPGSLARFFKTARNKANKERGSMQLQSGRGLGLQHVREKLRSDRNGCTKVPAERAAGMTMIVGIAC